jgi:cobalt/nickel transport system permease protein
MKDMGVFLGQLILRSFDRAERVYNAMRCRGFTGVYHSARARRFKASDLLFVMLTCPAIIALRFFNAAHMLGIFANALFRSLQKAL